MGVELTHALGQVEEAARILFHQDPATRSVGVGLNGDGYGFIAVRNASAPVAFAGAMGAATPTTPARVLGIPVHYTNSGADPASLVRLPHTGPGSPGRSSLVPEQLQHRPLVCGLQIQNFDDDVHTGEIGRGSIIIGTLGCFVRLADQSTAILSNNHVVAGENRGRRGQDRILQPGSASFASAQHVATLTDFKPLQPSPMGASLMAGTVVLNEIDAGIARLEPGQLHVQGYLPNRIVKPPLGIATAAVGDAVHKVGRTTGLTFGTVMQVGVVVGPVGYGIGGCWFQQSIVIEGLHGATFSDHGDSGSAIVRDADGMMVGLLYAGNGTQTYGCPPGTVMNDLQCRLA